MKKIFLKIALLLTVIAAVILIRLVSSNEDHDAEMTAMTASHGLTLIIDPGHGGMDGGATSPGGLRESELNLDIAQRLDFLMGFFGVRTVMTRDTEDITYSQNATTIRAKKNEDIRNRINLINSTENAVLISIHQNLYPSPGPFGAQVLYARTAGSAEFAKSMQELLISTLNPQNNRPAVPVSGKIFLMNNVKMPAILIECAFLSNPDEEALLKTDEYRLKIATAIAAGYLRHQNLLEDTVLSGGTNENQNGILLH